MGIFRFLKKGSLSWTLALGFCATLFAQCPAEIWHFAIHRGVQPEPFPGAGDAAGSLLRAAGVPLLRQAPVRLRYAVQKSGRADLPDLAELSLVAESHATLGGKRMGTRCESWRLFVQAGAHDAALRFLYSQWLGRWYVLHDSLPETTDEKSDPFSLPSRRERNDF